MPTSSSAVATSASACRPAATAWPRWRMRASSACAWLAAAMWSLAPSAYAGSSSRPPSGPVACPRAKVISQPQRCPTTSPKPGSCWRATPMPLSPTPRWVGSTTPPARKYRLTSVPRPGSWRAPTTARCWACIRTTGTRTSRSPTGSAQPTKPCAASSSCWPPRSSQPSALGKALCRTGRHCPRPARAWPSSMTPSHATSGAAATCCRCARTPTTGASASTGRAWA